MISSSGKKFCSFYIRTLFSIDGRRFDEYETVIRMRTGWENGEARREPSVDPTCPHQFPNYFTWDGIRPAEKRRLTS
jgi:hypothetical protein